MKIVPYDDVVTTPLEYGDEPANPDRRSDQPTRQLNICAGDRHAVLQAYMHASSFVEIGRLWTGGQVDRWAG